MKIGLTPRLDGVGGMVSFQFKLAEGLERRGWGVTYDLDEPGVEAVLVIGGTRRLGALWRLRRQGVAVIQRLDGRNWIHRLRQPGRPRTGLRHYLRAEYGNRLLNLIRCRLATGIVYQSEFSRRWWEGQAGPAPVPGRIIYNGVDLDAYTPAGPHQRPADRCRLLMVEGSLMGGYEQGLEAGVELARRLPGEIRAACGADVPVELQVAGRVAPQVRGAWTARAARLGVSLAWAGLVPRQAIPELDRSAHLLYSADVNAACPNSVIEALACGLPVAAFDTGALPELVQGDAGRIASYGGDPWKLDPPDLAGLARQAAGLWASQAACRAAARQRAEEAFGLEPMVAAYLRALAGEPG